MIERHHQRPDDIIESGALDGRDHHGRRHAWIELDVGHRGELALVDLNKRYLTIYSDETHFIVVFSENWQNEPK
jgi:hypothetical protein